MFRNRGLQLTFTLVVLSGIGLGFYWQTNEKSVVINVEPSKIEKPTVKKEKSRVVLKAFVTVCQKLTVTVPLDVGLITQSDDLRIIKGYVENRGNTPVQFVKLQVVWSDEKGGVLEYDEVYATTEKALMPGEKANFQSSKRNMLIAKCNVKIQDWWVVTDPDKNPV